MRACILGLIVLIAAVASSAAVGETPSVYVVSRSTEASGKSASDAAGWASWMEGVLTGAALKRIPCGRVMDESSARAMLGFERQRQLLGAGDDAALANLGGAIGARHLIVATTTVLGGQAHVTVSAIDSRTAKATARVTKSFAIDELEQAKQFANDFVKSVPGLRCPAWTGTVNVSFSGSGTDPTGASVTGNTTVNCTLDGTEDEMATCQVSTQGGMKDKDGGSMSTQGSGKVRTTIGVGGDSQVTTVKVGTFKLKVHTDVTLVLKADDGTSSTVSNSVDEEREDGGWEFTGPGVSGNHRAGSWTSPDGFFKAQWDLTFK
jgi:hypothetical protein